MRFNFDRLAQVIAIAAALFSGMPVAAEAPPDASNAIGRVLDVAGGEVFVYDKKGNYLRTVKASAVPKNAAIYAHSDINLVMVYLDETAAWLDKNGLQVQMFVDKCVDPIRLAATEDNVIPDSALGNGTCADSDNERKEQK